MALGVDDKRPALAKLTKAKLEPDERSKMGAVVVGLDEKNVHEEQSEAHSRGKRSAIWLRTFERFSFP